MIAGTSIRLDLPLAAVEAFVLNSWLTSYEPRGLVVHGFKADNLRARKAFYASHHPELTRLVRGNSIAMCVVDEDPDVYVGWACGQPGLLHYVYVKTTGRGQETAAALAQAVCGDGPTVFTFEPGKRDGRVCTPLLAAAARRGWRFHQHPVPGMLVHRQREEMRR